MIDRERVAYSDPNRESVVVAIVEAVAEFEGVDVDEVNDPLYHTINPELLERLFRESAGQVTFEYSGYRVTVTNDYEVSVVDPDGDERQR